MNTAVLQHHSNSIFTTCAFSPPLQKSREKIPAVRFRIADLLLFLQLAHHDTPVWSHLTKMTWSQKRHIL